ncbi:MAG: 12,18-didecarboxysiroheme deacetylase, partial [Deltaproteobacteria bacterium RBG_19FT_COMBO_43_11]
KPVVVWNMTRRCNLKCIHCYSSSTDIDYPNELSTQEGKKIIDDLAQFGSPVILFSGGEPLLRPDLLELAQYAVDRKMRAVLSTNGTLITKEIAAKLQKIGLSYVGVSLDGLEKTHDRFRGKKGAFAQAIQGIRNCRQAGIKVGIRFTVNKHNLPDVAAMFDLLRSEKIERLCFYHLVYTGRGSKLRQEDLTHQETRKLLDLIMSQTKKMFAEGLQPEILTVDNHADGPYLYLKVKEENPARAKEVLELLEMNEGNSSGHGIGCISWDGEVYADQFWRNQPLGNIRQKPFSKIWLDEKNELLVKLKDKKKYVTGRCAACLWLSVCGGNFRARAEATGDIWGPDPACYLTDEEISKRED